MTSANSLLSSYLDPGLSSEISWENCGEIPKEHKQIFESCIYHVLISDFTIKM